MGEIASSIMYRLIKILCICEDFPGGSVVKNEPAKAQSLGWEDPLEKGKVTHSNIPVWDIPWTEKSGMPQRVRVDLATEHTCTCICEEFVKLKMPSKMSLY